MDSENNTYNDFNEYIENNEKTMQMLVVMSKNQNEYIKKLAQDERFQMIEKTREELNELTKENRNLKHDIKELETKYKNIEHNQIKMQEQLSKHDGLVNTIGFTGEDIEVSRAIRNRCFKFIKKKDSDLYYLFYKTYSSSLSASLKKEMKVRKYSMIHTTKFNDSLNYINKWKPSEKLRTKKIQELVELNASNKLNKSASGARVQLALDRYLSKTEGGTTKHAIQ